MADYVSILNKAISGLGENTSDNRQIIYQKARGAIDRKLRAMDPQPSEEAIANQLAQLEEAIDQIEGEQQLAELAQEPEQPAPSQHVPERETRADVELVAHPVPAPISAPAPAAELLEPAAVEVTPIEAPDQASHPQLRGIEAQIVPAANPPDGFIDDIILIDGIGEKTRQALAGEGITGISQIAAMDDGLLAAVTEKIGYPGFEQTQEWKQQSLEMLSGAMPRSKSGQDRLRKMQEEREVAQAAPVEVTTTETAQHDAAPAMPTPPPLANMPAVEPATAPGQASPTPPSPVQAPVHPPVETERTEVPKVAEQTAHQHDADLDMTPEQKAFADTIAELTGMRKPQANPQSTPAVGTSRAEAPVGPPPAAPVGRVERSSADNIAPDLVGTTSPVELRPGISVPVDAPLAGGMSTDAPPYVGQIEGDPYSPSGQEIAHDTGYTREEPVALKPRRNLGKSLGCAAILALLGGVGYAGWLYQDQVKAYGSEAMTAISALMNSGNDTSSSGAVTTGENASQPSEGTEEKDTTRLATDGDNTESLPASETPADNTTEAGSQTATGAGTEGDTAAPEETAEENAPRNILDEPVQQPAPVEEPATVEVEGQDEPIAETETTGSESGDQQLAQNDETQTPAADEQVQPAIAQGESAFLYEEAIGATGANRDEGGIVWSLAQEPPEEGAEPEAVIKGLFEIPARGLKLDMSIKRNVDPGLPASHLIELIFSAPADFSGGNIDNVSRFVMKATEQARGESLVGVPARIDTGYFLIALNNLDQARETNLRLLENGEWIDMPVAYVTGRRGLITLAKGASGKKVFSDALADWRNR